MGFDNLLDLANNMTYLIWTKLLHDKSSHNHLAGGLTLCLSYYITGYQLNLIPF